MSERDIVLLPQQNVALEDVKRLANIILALRTEVFKEGHDFGKIPGTGDKPTLLQPGMEKLCRALRVVPRYIEQCVIRDYDKPLFHFEYLCELVDVDTGKIIPGGSGIGLCTSMESKYRYRKASRVCPNCEKETIIKGKEEYGGGWVCYAKKGGCGAKFKDGDVVIESQVEGRVINEDIFDQINTIAKMSQKRALSSAIKGAANVSEFFTVDIEDFQSYDTAAPIVVMPDDGRPVDTATGEITPPAPLNDAVVAKEAAKTDIWAVPGKTYTTRLDPDVHPGDYQYKVVPLPMPRVPLPAGYKWELQPQVNKDDPEDELNWVAVPDVPVDTPDPALANLKALNDAQKFDDVALATRTEQPALGLVDKPEAPSSHKWVIGDVKNYVILEKAYCSVSAHFDNLINTLYDKGRINDSTTTEGVIAEIDEHYKDGHHLKKSKKAS